jgi:hypothetical protein
LEGARSGLTEGEGELPPSVLNFFQGQMSSVRLGIIVLQDDLSSRTFIAQCTKKLEWCLNIIVAFMVSEIQSRFTPLDLVEAV